MKITMVVEGLILPEELKVMNEACALIATKLRRDLYIDYNMATPYKVLVPRPIVSVDDLDDEFEGVICAAFEPEACCEDDQVMTEQTLSQQLKRENK